MSTREFTGRKMLILTVGAFSVIIGVNLLLAFKAVATFPGLEVANSYVASQTFDAERKAQIALGWTAKSEVVQGTFRLAITGPDGRPVQPAKLEVLVGRVTGAADDQTPELSYDGTAFVAPMALQPGLWQVMIRAEAVDGTLFHQRLDMHIGA